MLLPLQKHQGLLLKSSGPVIFDLILDVMNGFWSLQDAHTKSAITLLRAKVVQRSKSLVRSVQSSRWDEAILLMIPGTSCLATIVLSLRDKSYSPIEVPRNYLSACRVETTG